MLFLLRNIRRKLMSDRPAGEAGNKITTYLLYAIGEIVLVVVGILIAVQIDNWNEAENLKQKEHSYLKNLMDDLQNDLISLDEIIKERHRKSEAGLALLKVNKVNTINDLIHIDTLTDNLLFWRVFEPSDNTFQELVSSGQLQNISNDSIKAKLLNLVRNYKQIANHRDHMRREYDHYLYDNAIKYSGMLSIKDFEKSMKINEIVRLDSIPTELLNQSIQQYNNLLSDVEYRNGIQLAILNNHFAAIRFQECLVNVEQLISIIKSELNS